MRTKKLMFVIIAVALLFSIAIAYAGVKTRSYSVSVAADATAAQTAALVTVGERETFLAAPMLLYQLNVTIPDTTNGVTFTVAIIDSSSRVIWSQASLADNTGTAPHILSPTKIVDSGCSLAITPSGATGNAIVLTVVAGFIG